MAKCHMTNFVGECESDGRGILGLSSEQHRIAVLDRNDHRVHRFRSEREYPEVDDRHAYCPAGVKQAGQIDKRALAEQGCPQIGGFNPGQAAYGRRRPNERASDRYAK